MIKHTDWIVADPGYALGCNDQVRFGYYAKMQLSWTPVARRTVDSPNF
ncbi:hypothetical protein BH09BAC4_BH09BAC4_20930 [soil metagenome]